jgi:hypothetical protein
MWQAMSLALWNCLEGFVARSSAVPIENDTCWGDRSSPCVCWVLRPPHSQRCVHGTGSAVLTLLWDDTGVLWCSDCDVVDAALRLYGTDSTQLHALAREFAETRYCPAVLSTAIAESITGSHMSFEVRGWSESMVS